MCLIIYIIILIILIIYISNKKDIDYYLNILTFNPINKNVDITNINFKKKLKILILSTDNRNTEYIRVHKESWKNYSNIHDYTFIFEEPCDNLPIYYCKYQRMLQLMNEYPDYDYFLWVDSDTIINKNYLNFPLESAIEQVGIDTDFMYTEVNILSGFIPGNILRNIVKMPIGGFYLFKNNSNVKKLLQTCIDYIDYSKWKSKNKGNCMYAGECYEEAAMFYSIKNNNDIKSIRIIGNFLYNGMFCRDNFFIIHDLGKNVECFKKNEL